MTSVFPGFFVAAMVGVGILYVVLSILLERMIGRHESLRRLHSAQRVWAFERDAELAGRMKASAAAESRAA
jgi:hypothetical protein